MENHKPTLSIAPKESEISCQKTMLNAESFSKGMIILIASFPNLVIPKERAVIMHELLSDLSQEEFFIGLKEFCLKQKEIYPGTNIIAHIREYGKPEKKEKTVWDIRL